MKKKIFDLKLKNIRVNQSGCLDKCESGPVMVIYPEGIWYKYKNKLDIDEIIKTHLVKGKVVKRLMLKP
jgi:(2Fe-2S) ferredoxin